MKKSRFFISLTAILIASAIFASGCSTSEVGTVETDETDEDVIAEISEEITEATTEETTEETTEIPEGSEEYELVWSDEFDGDELNTANWSYAIHRPGFVNNELQSYGAYDDCVYIEDGDLVIQPIREVNEDNGRVSYRSGRINTYQHQAFKYGRVEARIKVPEGQGYLPAFWMLPYSESYGSWPLSGEIDIMEVLGSDTTTAHGTIHFGNPHEQRQSTYVLPEGDFSSEYHVFAIEWEPGIIRWFIDDVEIGSQSYWFTSGGDYPAPFNQEFYIILNVAIGGNWPGDPDETTPFDERAQMRVDYVRVYQRGYYDENVSQPEVTYDFRQPDETGNFIDEDSWSLLLAEGGAATMNSEDGIITVTSTEAGDVDYGVQLVNTGLPAADGTSYVVTFEARSDEARTMVTNVSAPDHGYIRYMEDETVELSDSWQTFSYSFTMSGSSDDNARLEFNMGGTDSTAEIQLRNVRVEETN